MRTVGLIFLTYAGSEERRQYARRSLATALEHLSYEPGIHVHIADDGSPDDHVKELTALAGGYPVARRVTVSNARRLGYGANYNRGRAAMKKFGCEVVLPLEDDWELLRPLRLDPWVQALDDGEISCIRMGYLGTTQPLRGQIIHREGIGTFLAFDPDSPEPHVFAGHPRLETQAYEDRVGDWPEVFTDDPGHIPTPGDTEFMVCHIKASRYGVVWPMDLVRAGGGLWAHIGARRSIE